MNVPDRQTRGLSMKRAMLAMLVLITALLAAAGAGAQQLSDPGDPAENAAASKVATRFLQQVDAGKVAGTWALTGPYLHGLTDSAGWTKLHTDLRASSGALKSRKLEGAVFAKELEGAPKGHYFVVFFTSRFANFTAEEKVALNLVGKVWRIEGYYLTKEPAPGQPESK